VCGETVCADTKAPQTYPNILKTIVEEGGYMAEQVCNMDGTRLF
jgi:hypothetical protein